MRNYKPIVVRDATDEEIWSRESPKVLYLMTKGVMLKVGISGSMRRRLKDLSGCKLERAYVVTGMKTHEFERKVIERLAGRLCCWTENTVEAGELAIQETLHDLNNPVSTLSKANLEFLERHGLIPPPHTTPN